MGWLASGWMGRSDSGWAAGHGWVRI